MRPGVTNGNQSENQTIARDRWRPTPLLGATTNVKFPGIVTNEIFSDSARRPYPVFRQCLHIVVAQHSMLCSLPVAGREDSKRSRRPVHQVGSDGVKGRHPNFVHRRGNAMEIVLTKTGLGVLVLHYNYNPSVTGASVFSVNLNWLIPFMLSISRLNRYTDIYGL